MANTVNDVMNVITNPDYGIKNIAGTTHEILAIMQGNHNSNNNLHAIVDDIKSLLQKLVGVVSENKPIEVGRTSTKINHRHIQDILDETKGIRKAIDNLAAKITKQGGNTMPTIAKLSDKSSKMVADAMIKNIDKQNGNGGISTLVDVFNKLKNISLKDIIIGKHKIKIISNIFNNAKDKLDIKDKDLDSIIKLINATPQMMKSLMNVSWKINKIIRKKVIEKLNNILVGENSILTISQILHKNEKVFIKANSAAKNLEELTTSLNEAMIKMIFTSFLSRMISDKSIQAIEKMLNNLTTIAQKLSKEKNVINKGVEASKQVTILIGNLFVSSILLTTTIVPALLGSIGALALKLMIETTMWSINTLSKKKKSIETSTKSAKELAVFAGQMAITSFMFATIAVTGIPAMVGMVLLKGILWLNEKMFKTLDKSKASITKGAIVMLLMGGSLILYGIALKKISEATKGMEWKQFGMIAALTGTFAVAMAALGIPIVAGLVALGSVTLGVMGLSLLTFAKSLKIINDLGTTPIKPLRQTLNAMNMVKNFFKENALDRKAIKNARRYNKIIRPFGKTIKHLAKLKEMGVIPMKLVHGALNAINTIANYYMDNPIDKKVDKMAKRYKDVLKPFGKTIKHLSKLKELGVIPMKLVHGALNAMNVISNYYINNPIEKKVIKEAKRYKKILKPFGKTIKHLSKLKEIGVIPMKLVHGALNAMNVISNYYINNPIEKKVIKEAKRYKKILKPFGKTIKYLSKLKEMGVIPMKLVHSALNAISLISNFYQKQNNGIFDNIKTSIITKLISTNISSFANSVDALKTIKGIQTIPTIAISNVVGVMSDIINFYNTTKLNKNIDKKTTFIESIISKFTNMYINIQDKFVNIKPINLKSVEHNIKYLSLITKFLKKKSLNSLQYKKAEKTLTLLKNMTSVMSDISNLKSSNISSVGEAISNTLIDVNKVDMERVKSVTNMFDTFNSINRSKNVINKFTESIKEFTTVCKNLIDTMNQNTDAINNIDGDMSNSRTNLITNNNIIENNLGNTNQNNGIRITNVDEIAKNIAEKINGALSVDVPDTQIQLLINGIGGNEWVISRY